MTLEELKAIALEEVEKMKGYKRSNDHIRGQVIGMFKLFRRIKMKDNFTDEEYNELLDVLDDVLNEI